ncbi:MAG: transcriptional regulator [Methylomonas sp.]|nr:MAG: transcriptional regulator [Methylomonas sp.]
MPNDNLSAAIKEAYASAPSDSVIIHTLEFRHAGFLDSNNQVESIRVCLDYRDWEAKLEDDAALFAGQFKTFVGYNFDIELPGVESLASPTVKITIDNVSQEIITQLDQAVILPDLLYVTYRPYLSNDVDGSGRLNAPHMDPVLTLQVDQVSADSANITAIASFGDFANRRFPFEEYTVTRFPGLAQ